MLCILIISSSNALVLVVGVGQPQEGRPFNRAIVHLLVQPNYRQRKSKFATAFVVNNRGNFACGKLLRRRRHVFGGKMDSPSLSLRKRLGSRLFPSSGRLSIDAGHFEDNSSMTSSDHERSSPSLSLSSLSPSRSFRKLLPRTSALGLREKKISDVDLSSDDIMLGLEACESARRLEKALSDRIFRNDLVDELLAQHSEDARKVRMVCAINEVLRTVDRTERVTKAGMVSSLFVKADAKFAVHGIPTPLQQDILQSKLDGFLQLRNLASRELLCNSTVEKLLVEFERVRDDHDDDDGDAAVVVNTLDSMIDDEVLSIVN